MNCKKCGSPLTVEDQFCRNCGAVVGEENAQLNQNVANNDNRFIFENQNQNNIGNNFQPINNSNNYNNNNNFQPLNNNLNNYSQPMNNLNNMNYNNQNGNNNSAKKIIFIAAGVALVIIITVLLVVVIMKIVGNSNNTNNSNSENGSNSTAGIPTNNASSYKVVYNNFTFTIPDTMDYEIRSDSLIVGDLDATWIIQMSMFGGSFNNLKKNKYLLQSEFLNSGITTTAPEIKTLGGQEYLTFEMSGVGETALGAYTQLNSSYVAWIVVENQNGDIDYSILEKVAPIIKSAKYGNYTSNLEVTSKFNIDIDKIIDLAQ